jgi:hypothetical protein
MLRRPGDDRCARSALARSSPRPQSAIARPSHGATELIAHGDEDLGVLRGPRGGGEGLTTMKMASVMHRRDSADGQCKSVTVTVAPVMVPMIVTPSMVRMIVTVPVVVTVTTPRIPTPAAPTVTHAAGSFDWINSFDGRTRSRRGSQSDRLGTARWEQTCGKNCRRCSYCDRNCTHRFPPGLRNISCQI